jgi:hypothetical protein
MAPGSGRPRARSEESSEADDTAPRQSLALFANMDGPPAFSGAGEPVLTPHGSTPAFRPKISSPRQLIKPAPRPRCLEPPNHTPTHKRSPSLPRTVVGKEESSRAWKERAMKMSSGSHVIGVPVTAKAYAIEEAARDRPPAKTKDGDRLAVSLTHPSSYAPFGYKHGTSSIRPSRLLPLCSTSCVGCCPTYLMLTGSSHAMVFRQQEPGDPLGEQAGKTSSELQGPW